MDVDFTRRRGSTGLRLGPLIAPMFMDQLRKDVELLKVLWATFCIHADEKHAGLAVLCPEAVTELFTLSAAE